MEEEHPVEVTEYATGNDLYCPQCGATTFIKASNRLLADTREWIRMHQAPLPFLTPAERPAVREDF